MGTKYIQMSKVGIIMGSTSDLPIMQEAIDILTGFDIEIEVDIVSAHRTPEKLFDYGKNAHKRGFAVMIAGAGGAAHLPGMIASWSPLPVIGVTVQSRNSVAGWWLGTFHSLAARILRANAELVNLKNTFTIIDTDDQIRLIKKIL